MVSALLGTQVPLASGVQPGFPLPRHHIEVTDGTWHLTMINGVPWARPPAWAHPTRPLLRNASHHPPIPHDPPEVHATAAMSGASGRGGGAGPGGTGSRVLGSAGGHQPQHVGGDGPLA